MIAFRSVEVPAVLGRQFQRHYAPRIEHSLSHLNISRAGSNSRDSGSDLDDDDGTTVVAARPSTLDPHRRLQQEH